MIAPCKLFAALAILAAVLPNTVGASRHMAIQSHAGESEPVFPDPLVFHQTMSKKGTEVLEKTNADADEPLGDCSKPTSADWLNKLVADGLWPVMEEAVSEMTTSTIVPLVQSYLGSIATFSVDPFKLGKPITFDSMTVCQTANKQGMKLFVPLSYKSDSEFNVKFGSIPVGVKNIRFSGEVVVRLDQFIPEVPIVGGVAMHLIDPPEVDFELTGVAKVTEVTGVRSLVRRVVDDVIASLFVMPNQFVTLLGDKDRDGISLARMKNPRPVSVLRVHPVSAKDLVSQSYVFGVDPYVQVKIGEKTWKSATVDKNENPKWGDQHGDFLVYDRRQKIQVSVWDSDWLTADDMLGTVQKAPLVVHAPKQTKPMHLKDANDKDAGELTLRFEKLQITADAEKTDGAYVLAVEIDKVIITGFENEIGQIKVKAKVTSGENKKTLIEKETPYMSFVVEKMSWQPLIEKLTAKKMSSEDIADVTGLSVDAVKKAQDKKIRADSGEVDMHSILYYVLPADVVAQNGAVEFEVSSSKEFLCRKEVKLSTENMAAKSKGDHGFDLHEVTSYPLSKGDAGVTVNIGFTLLGVAKASD